MDTNQQGNPVLLLTAAGVQWSALPAGCEEVTLERAPGLAAEQPQAMFLLLYCPPWQYLAWHARHQAGVDLLRLSAEWLGFYRKALQLRNVLGKRLLIINAQHNGPWQPECREYLL